ncbi:MAG: sigma-70 family RNA polymerase sigma factor [Candidatus Cloacimonetes bacterium]|nr:sigma-70 family RNA polymerase sigma factor [Candidatus Cloacimonadota bacterium]
MKSEEEKEQCMRYSESMDEKEIIKLAKTDYQAFDFLYEKYMPQIFQYVMYRVYNREVTEDIVSIVFYKAMKNLHLFTWRQIPFSAWLYRIAFNEICNYVKKEKKQEKIRENYLKEEPEAAYEPSYQNDSKSFKFIHDYIAKLPIKDQDIIMLRFFEKKSFAEIALITGKNESTLRVNLHRALKKLESIMPEEVLDYAYRQISL